LLGALRFPYSTTNAPFMPSPPTKLGDTVNTAVGETCPSLSSDAQTLYFGRTPRPEGMGDIFVSTRDKLKGPDD